MRSKTHPVPIGSIVTWSARSVNYAIVGLSRDSHHYEAVRMGSHDGYDPGVMTDMPNPLDEIRTTEIPYGSDPIIWNAQMGEWTDLPPVVPGDLVRGTRSGRFYIIAGIYNDHSAYTLRASEYEQRQGEVSFVDMSWPDGSPVVGSRVEEDADLI